MFTKEMLCLWFTLLCIQTLLHEMKFDQQNTHTTFTCKQWELVYLEPKCPHHDSGVRFHRYMDAVGDQLGLSKGMAVGAGIGEGRSWV